MGLNIAYSNAVVSNPCVYWQTEYRNKCEFLISVGADGEDKTVGFRLGKYKGGSCAVVGPEEACHVSAEAKKIVHDFQKFIRCVSINESYSIM